MSLGPGVPDPPAVRTFAFSQQSRHRIDERLLVHVRSMLGGLHHEYSLAPALG